MSVKNTLVVHFSGKNNLRILTDVIEMKFTLLSFNFRYLTTNASQEKDDNYKN